MSEEKKPEEKKPEEDKGRSTIRAITRVYLKAVELAQSKGAYSFERMY